MEKPKRYTPHIDFPPYAFVPGRNPHPEKVGGHMEGVELKLSALNPQYPLENQDFLYAIDLYNYGFYWESHVWWEELWNIEGRKGDLADLLKALIKLAAAGVKQNLDHDSAAKGHLERSVELLLPLSQKSDSFCGLKLNHLIDQIKELQHDEKGFKLPFLIIS